MNLKRLFINHCKTKRLEINNNQIVTIKIIDTFYQNNFNYNFFTNLFSKKENIPGFYLQGDVGVGKTMILNLCSIFIVISLDKSRCIMILGLNFETTY